MLLLRVDTLREGPNWEYEVKLDGYRAIAFELNGKIHLRSRNNKSFKERYPAIVDALGHLPNETGIGCEFGLAQGSDLKFQ